MSAFTVRGASRADARIGRLENFRGRVERHLRQGSGVPQGHSGLFSKECERRFSSGNRNTQAKQLEQRAANTPATSCLACPSRAEKPGCLPVLRQRPRPSRARSFRQFYVGGPSELVTPPVTKSGGSGGVSLLSRFRGVSARFRLAGGMLIREEHPGHERKHERMVVPLELSVTAHRVFCLAVKHQFVADGFAGRGGLPWHVAARVCFYVVCGLVSQTRQHFVDMLDFTPG